MNTNGVGGADDMNDDGMFPDEPWEAEIASLLGGLAMVDPPPGFIDQAIDHRPLFAGRTLAGLAVAAMIVLGMSFGLGAFGQPNLAPDLSVLTSGAAVQTTPSVSVFREPGEIELDQFAGGERVDVAGNDAWVDSENGVVVVNTDTAVVTMVGVTPAEAADLIDEVDDGPGGLAGLVNQLTAGVGFPDLG